MTIRHNYTFLHNYPHFHMNESIKTKWITALTNGEYEQGHHQLRFQNHFCCLGVLCDLFIKETGTAQWDYGHLFNDGTGPNVTFPSRIVQNWAGIDKKDMTMLSAYNDSGFSGNEK